MSTDAGHLSLKPYMHEEPAKHHRHCEKSLNRSKLRVISIVESLSQSAPSDEFTRVGNFSFVDTCIVSDGLITLCIMPNCLADNISLYCGDPYERFACILVYEDLFTRRFRQLRRAPFAARLG